MSHGTCAHCQKESVLVRRPAMWNAHVVLVCVPCWREWRTTGSLPALPDMPMSTAPHRRPQCLDDIERRPLKWKGER